MPSRMEYCECTCRCVKFVIEYIAIRSVSEGIARVCKISSQGVNSFMQR